MENGHGLAADMFMHAATGPGQGPGVYGFAGHGNMVSVDIGGIKVIGDKQA